MGRADDERDLDSLIAEVRKLRRALKPFAEIALARDWTEAGPDMIEGPDLRITPRQVRAARSALR